jgi:hypothetical protein
MVYMALEAFICSGNDISPQHWGVLRAIHTLNTPHNYIHLLRGLLPIHSSHQCRAQGLMQDIRGTFLLVVAMVSHGCVGHFWP